MKDITKATNEELQQFLSGSYEDDSEDTATDGFEEFEDSVSSDEDDADDYSDYEDSEDDEESDEEDSEEDAEEDEESGNEEKVQESSVDRLTELQTEVQALKSQVQAKEQMIQRQGNELGELRALKKDIEVAIREKEKEIEEVEGIDTRAFFSKSKELETLQGQLSRVSTQERVVTHSQKAFAVADKVMPPFEGMDQEIVELLKLDGESDQNINAFLSNPGVMGEAAPVLLVQLRKRAFERKLLKQAHQALQDIAKANGSLGTKQTSSKVPPAPQKRRIRSTDVSSSTRETTEVSPEAIRSMSTKQLKAFEERLRKIRR